MKNNGEKRTARPGGKRLSDITCGDKCRLSHFEWPESDFARKLAAMGFVEGTEVELADTGRRDPMVFCIRNVRIAIRKREAESVFVF